MGMESDLNPTRVGCSETKTLVTTVSKRAQSMGVCDIVGVYPTGRGSRSARRRVAQHEAEIIQLVLK